MRIGIDARMITWSGIGRYTVNLIEGLREYIPDTFEVILYANDVDKDTPSLQRSEDTRYVNLPVFNPQSFYNLNRVIAKDSIDVFHSPHFVIPMGARDYRLVATIHDLIPLAMPETMPNSIGRIYYRYLNRLTAKKADHIIVPSDYTRSDVIKYLSIQDAKATVARCALDDVFMSTAGDRQNIDELVQKYKIKRPYFLALGNQKPNKGLECLVDAYAEYLQQAPASDVDLIIIGKPDLRFPEPYNHVKKYRLESRIRFIDGIDDSELISFYAHSLAFVFPSLYEGFGLPPLEAMACRTPVISSNRTSIPEVVDAAALVVDPSDTAEFASALTLITNDDAARSDLIQKGLHNLERFSKQDFTRSIITAYEKSLNQ